MFFPGARNYHLVMWGTCLSFCSSVVRRRYVKHSRKEKKKYPFGKISVSMKMRPQKVNACFSMIFPSLRTLTASLSLDTRTYRHTHTPPLMEPSPLTLSRSLRKKIHTTLKPPSPFMSPSNKDLTASKGTKAECLISSVSCHTQTHTVRLCSSVYTLAHTFLDTHTQAGRQAGKESLISFRQVTAVSARTHTHIKTHRHTHT